MIDNSEQVGWIVRAQLERGSDPLVSFWAYKGLDKETAERVVADKMHADVEAVASLSRGTSDALRLADGQAWPL